MKTYGSTYSTWALDRGEWSASHPGHFIPRERAPGIFWIGMLMNPKAGLDVVMKRNIPSLPLPGVELQSRSL